VNGLQVHSTASSAGPGVWEPAPESALPVRRLSAVQVVFDGARRLLWSSRGPAAWRPDRIWPSPAERDRILADLRSGTPVLVLLEPRSVPVPVLPEELERAPRPLRERAVGLGGDEYAVPVALLDWLPDRYRRRGLDFLRTGGQMLESNPKLLLSSLIVDQAAQPGEPVRFALRTWARAVPDRDLAECAAALFPAQPGRRRGRGSVPRPRSAA
jgi:hypothetical protein